MSLSRPPRSEDDAHPVARGGRRLTAVLGPTNTGKTHLAVERMLGHASGMIGLPLRLLAREIYDRVAGQVGENAVALITGEEKIVPAAPRFFVCTVESMPLDRPVEFLAIDEIQLAADPERGHVFTDRLMRARGLQETMFLGADTMRPLIRQLLPDCQFISRPRFSDLTYTGPKKLSRLPRRSAIVAFSADAVYGLAEVVRRQRGGAAVVMGALSPRTRNAQVALYQSGDVDFLVATDAIGMGLNMDVDHVAFASLAKFDGVGLRPLRATEVAQIAGRAGRYMNDGTFGPTTDVPPFEAQMVEQIEQHRFDPVRLIQWRNPDLDFASLAGLIASLERAPPAKGLARARAADDLTALKLLSEDADIAERARGEGALRRLWDVCQVPDFRRVTADEHVRLLAQLYRHLMDHDGTIPADWIGPQIERIDVTEGDIDTLSARLAQIRIWTYVSHRAGWLADQAHWQERTRAIEDRLSDALHEALTLRFIDRRTSVLMRRLREDDELISSIDAEGEVSVAGEYVGRLNGFVFAPDPRGAASELGPRTLRHAAQRALGAEIAARAQRLVGAPDQALQLSEHGKIWWEGSPIARLTPGADPLGPRVELMVDESLATALREAVQTRLEGWARAHIGRILQPLVALRDAPDLEGLGRGLAFQLVEALGGLPRADVAEMVRALDQTARGALRRYGVRFGAHSIFLPQLIKPQAAQLKLLLWMVAEDAPRKGLRLPTPPAPGLVSLAVEPGVPRLFYERAGFRVCGPRAIRLDMLERLADLLRPPRPLAATTPVAAHDAPPVEAPAGELPVAEAAAPAEPPAAELPDAAAAEALPPVAVGKDAAVKSPDRVAPDGSFIVSTEMMSLVGCSGPEFEALLRTLGFRAVREPDADAAAPPRWRPGHRRTEDAPRRRRRPHAADEKSDQKTEQASPPEESAPRKQARRPRRSREDEAGGRGRPDHAKGARGDGGERSERGEGERPASGGKQKPGPRPPRPPRETPVDPNSPFAALAALRQSLLKRG